MPDKLYYAKGREVWKSPVRTKIEGGDSVTLGFHACTASEVIGEEGATAIAALLCLGEEAQASPKDHMAPVNDLISRIAATPIWQDTYPDGPDTMDGDYRVTPDDVRACRAVTTEGK